MHTPTRHPMTFSDSGGVAGVRFKAVFNTIIDDTPAGWVARNKVRA